MADPRSKELNMLDGPILPRILQFTLPLAATGMLQLLFNAADVIVVGKFSGSIALAAVGATSTNSQGALRSPLLARRPRSSISSSTPSSASLSA